MFLFWTGVVVAGMVVSHFIIEWFKGRRATAAQANRREIGFHAAKEELTPA